MPDALRVAQKDPDGKMHHTTFSLRFYTREEAEKKAVEWKEQVKAGNFQKRSYPGTEKKEPEVAQSDESELSESETESVRFSFPRKTIKDLQLPDEGGCSMLFLGTTRSGKTTLIKAIYAELFEDMITVLHTCSPSAKTYSDLKKKCILAPAFCREAIEEAIRINQRTDNRYNFMHIIDDCVSSKNDSTMIKLLTIGRNSMQNTLISGQELSILNAIGRSNINFVFLGKLGSSMAVEKCVRQYLQAYFPSDLSMPDKIKMYTQLTSDYNWICLDMVNNEAYMIRLNK